MLGALGHEGGIRLGEYEALLIGVVIEEFGIAAPGDHCFELALNFGIREVFIQQVMKKLG